MSYLEGKKILVTGATGFVGRNLIRELRNRGLDLLTPTRKDYDLMVQGEVRRMFRELKPEVVFHLAGKVGGILANKESPAEFFYNNILLNTMVIHEAYLSGVEKLITLIGGCSYPAGAPSPISEDQLFNGYPQPESAPYSLAKAMSVVQAQAYRKQYGFNAIVLVPGNLYGPYDNFDLESSHVIPALIRKFHEARKKGLKKVTVWGSGKPVRDFIYVEDACKVIVRAAEIYNEPDIINVSSGKGISIAELVDLVAEVVGFDGEIVWDRSKPDGQMIKIFDVKRMEAKLGKFNFVSLKEGLRKTYQWYLENLG
ncbi:MAG: GDP-L-fucose synthase [Candidatus Neomarinimicrobiota bacterium]|nr:MAG: GDP-L-fucose synthase [Candidatus Neomarinimicrobiota bacterium]